MHHGTQLISNMCLYIFFVKVHVIVNITSLDQGVVIIYNAFNYTTIKFNVVAKPIYAHE